MQVEIMSIERLHSPFLGFPLKGFVTGQSYGNSAFAVRGNHVPRAYSKAFYSYQNHKKCHKLSFSQFGWRKVDILAKNSGSRSTSKMNCIEERFSQSKALARSFFFPLRKIGLLLVRCPVFVAVISALGLLVWYAHRRTKYYMESKSPDFQ